ncbi:MAG TPA: DUF6519 domain-containing protein [Silvibacterium sp.]|nr:DUF6519 domain-containing protein [Silvibacterium sp.]
MKGDFSLIRFNPSAQYTAVLKQQGRVDLDSDANEQYFIDSYIDGLTNVDVIGQYGGPVGNAGFQIGVSGDSITIGPGRYYVNGLLVENSTSMPYDEQPYPYDLTYTAELLLAAINAGGNTVQFVLEVWQQLVTGLDDNGLLEPALGQADTTVRLKTLWRVVGSMISTSTVPASGPVDAANPVTLLAPCCQMLYGNTPTVHDGLLMAAPSQSGNDCGCQPIAAAGYQGLENQLYRVEIHNPGAVGAATFKWSRENASVVSQITYISGAVLTVSSLGPDANLGFQNSQWVELTDDTCIFPDPVNQRGNLYQILTVNQATLQVTLTTPVSGVDSTKNARMRRWDQFGATATAQGVATSSTAVLLENGIEVTFGGGGNYCAGDYWTIPARTASGQIEWPPYGSDGKPCQPPSYTQISAAPLACMTLRPSNANVLQAGQTAVENYIISDCRLLFSPLTALSDEAPADAIHVTATSWNNDDVMTVDTLLQSGLLVIFDQAPTCPWGGGNFQVSMELPASADPFVPYEGEFGFPAPGSSFPPGTNIFGRTVMALDPPLGMSVSGTLVTWIPPAASLTGFGVLENNYLYNSFNAVLNATQPIGFARMRVRLDGGAVYANGTDGNLYLDGTALGETGIRAADGSRCVSLPLPTGNQLKAADFESWFYLAPSLTIFAATIQLLNDAGTQVGTNAVTVASNEIFFGHGLVTTASPAVAVTTVNLAITFTYPPVAPATLTFQITYSGAASIISIPNQTVSPGQTATLNVPISIIGNPGVGTTANVDTVTIVPAISGLLSPVAFAGTAPTLVITGAPENSIPVRFGGVSGIGLEGATNPFQNAAEVAKQTLDKQASEQPKEEEAKTPPKPEEAKTPPKPEDPKE